ncbi:hypothetical protein JZ751_020507 [Albula glossodonta]|uniref:Uncharacterized protein n=1 Tax=Albula glossodonta TaxID=121402 RepID=A0A8T2PHZ0_9TELE|nr:hypothetical protein JZ751_020507 [Albula glossodonta]
MNHSFSWTIPGACYLDKIEQAAETPGHGVEPLGARVRPARVHQLCQVTVGEVAAPSAGWEVLLCHVAGGEMANTQEVTVSVVQRRGEPAYVELQVSLGCLHISPEGDVFLHGGETEQKRDSREGLETLRQLGLEFEGRAPGDQNKHCPPAGSVVARVGRSLGNATYQLEKSHNGRGRGRSLSSRSPQPQTDTAPAQAHSWSSARSVAAWYSQPRGSHSPPIPTVTPAAHRD